MCVGFWPACAHFFVVRRALLLGHACTFNGQCALFLFSVRAIFFPVRALLLGHARDFFRPMRTFFFPVRAIYFSVRAWVNIAVRAVWLFLGVLIPQLRSLVSKIPVFECLQVPHLRALFVMFVPFEGCPI